MNKLVLGILVAVLILVGAYLIFRTPSPTTTSNPDPYATVSSSPTSIMTPQPSPTISGTPLAEKVRASIVTPRGTIQLELYPKVAPKTVANFVALANAKYYDGIKFPSNFTASFPNS
jgi:hypothetical protein